MLNIFETIIENFMIFYAISVIFILGLFTKILVQATLKRLIKEAGNMAKSTHGLMHLVRAKFEHTCMLSDKVQNVNAFVEKYLYEFRVFKIRLHSFRQFEKVAIWLCLILGFSGAGVDFSMNGMSDRVLRCGVFGAVAAIFLFLFLISADEKYQLDAAKMYMVDFLENIYARRFEKKQQKKKEPEIKEIPVQAPEIPVAEPEIRELPEAVTAREQDYPQAEKIREILEEFLA